MTLSWIRELAPVIIHVDLKTIAEFLRRIVDTPQLWRPYFALSFIWPYLALLDLTWPWPWP